MAQRRAASFRIQHAARLAWEFQPLSGLLEDVVDRLLALPDAQVGLVQIPGTSLWQLLGRLDTIALVLVGRRDASGAWLTVEVVHAHEPG